MSISHASVPVRVIFSLFPYSFQNVNGVLDKFLIYFIIISMRLVISQYCQIAISPAKQYGQFISTLFFRDSFNGFNTPGKFIVFIPLFKLFQQIVHTIILLQLTFSKQKSVSIRAENCLDRNAYIYQYYWGHDKSPMLHSYSTAPLACLLACLL